MGGKGMCYEFFTHFFLLFKKKFIAFVSLVSGRPVFVYYTIVLVVGDT